MIKRYDNISLKKLNTFGLDVTGRAYVTFDSADDLRQIVADESLPRPFLAMGGGSNMLFTRDFSGTVLHNDMKYIKPYSSPTAYGLQLVKVGGGVRLDYLCQWACSNNLWGIENLSGIPGEVSGAIVQNVGAYGEEFGDSVHAVKLFDLEQRAVISTSAAECEFGYRHSVFKEPELKGRLVVLEVTVALSRDARPKLEYGNLASHFAPGVVPSPRQVRDAVLLIRGRKLPDVAEYGSAGSFFKNPVVDAATYQRLVAQWPDMPHYDVEGGVKVPAAWLIDQCGLKDATVGGAAVWSRQPLVLYNRDGNATPDDVVALARHVIDTVESRFGIRLSPEVEYVSD